MIIFYSGDKNPIYGNPERVLGNRCNVMTSFGTIHVDKRGMARFARLVKARRKRDHILRRNKSQ